MAKKFNKESILTQGLTVNLSNFALFLSVMQDKRAYRNTLSIIMGEPG